MRGTLLKLNLRLIFTSLMFVLAFVFTLGAFVVFTGYMAWSPFIHPINFTAVIEGLEYVEVGLYVLAFCHGMYCSHQKCLLEEICFIPRPAAVLSKLCASVIATSTVCLIPTGFILISAVREGTGLLFTLNALCFVLIRWLCLLLTANTAGFFLGYLVKSTYSYILAAPAALLASYFNETAFDQLFTPLFGWRSRQSVITAELLSVTDSHLAAADMDYPGSRLDLYFLLDALFLVLVSLLLIWLLHLVVSRRLSIKKAAVGVLLAGALVSTVSVYARLCPPEYTCEDKLFHTNSQPQPYKITSCEGNFKLSEFSRFQGRFTVQPIGEQRADTLTIRLDGCFTVDELTCGGSPVAYSREGDFLTMDAPSGPAAFDIAYHGRVYYRSEIGCVNLFTSWLSAALPADFAFVPLIDGDWGTKDYDIRVTSLNTVISNLDVVSEGNQYHLSGKAPSICLFAGFLTEYERDGITIYRAKYNAVTDYEERLAYAMTQGCLDPRTLEWREGGGFEMPDKVFMIYGLYGTYGAGAPIVYEDHVLLNYGYTK